MCSGVLPDGMPEARIERVANAVFRPPGPGDMEGMRQGCGVFLRDGTVVAAGIASSDGELALPVPPPEGVERFREGAWVYGGLLVHHFGHALIYSLSRLWAVRRLQDEGVALRGVLFHRRYSEDPAGAPELPRNVVSLLGVFDPGLPVVAVGEVEEVETLYVPAQGISTTKELFLGLPEQRRFYRDCAARIAPNAEPRDVYISRTRTGWKGNHLFEAEIERALAAAGYLIYHPQMHPLEDQIATYRSARRVIAVDGSALHVAAMAVPQSAKVAILSRRAFFAWAIADQIVAFSGCAVQVIEAHAEVYAFSRGMGRPASWSKTQVTTDFARLGEELVAGGFLAALPEWRLPTEADLVARLAAATAKVGDELVPMPARLRRREPDYLTHRHGEG